MVEEKKQTYSVVGEVDKTVIRTIMKKQQVIKRLTKGHKKLEETIARLSKEQLINVPVIEGWMVKDIIAHISAWNWESIKTIDEILADKKPWHVDIVEDDFNRKEVKKRKKWSLENILDEWQDSFKALIRKIETLSDNDWEYKTNYLWSDGTIVSIQSFFDYEYEEADHAGGHAKQIEEFFRT